MPLGTEVGLGLCDIVFDVDPAIPRKRAHPAQFLVHVYCGQMAGWMKTPLGTELDLGPGDIVLDGVPAPAKGAQQPPLFGQCLLWPRSPISATAELLFVIRPRCSSAYADASYCHRRSSVMVCRSVCGSDKKDREPCKNH